MSDQLEKDMTAKLAMDIAEANKRVVISMLMVGGSSQTANMAVTRAAAGNFITVLASSYAQLSDTNGGSDKDIYTMTGELARDIIGARDELRAALNNPTQKASMLADLRKIFGEHHGRA